MASAAQDFPFGIREVTELLQLKVRKRLPGNIYVDCPFCGDHRGKMNVNFVKNVWRCNYCGEHGGMLALYAKLHGISNSQAFCEICDALQTDDWQDGYAGVQVAAGAQETVPRPAGLPCAEPESLVTQSERASLQQIHQTLSLLFSQLTLRPEHRSHLRSEKRGLSDEQIERFGFKSTPPPAVCRVLTERLLKQGCTVQGVPGFYLDDFGRWTVNFGSWSSGILIPAIGVDGLLRGAQILLDKPMRSKDDPPDKKGAKYIWFSSSNKNMGVGAGSPIHFVGNPFARTVYVTEGLLKADIAHCLMNRSFVAIAGANNVGQLEPLFRLLAQNGTELVIEAHDMDKFSNKAISAGASKIYAIARRCGMDCRRLTWNPNFKGVDDWQLALRRNENQQKEMKSMNFKYSYLYGECDMDAIDTFIEKWHNNEKLGRSLREYLGLTETEYSKLQKGTDRLKELLDKQRRKQAYRVYQLYLGADHGPVQFVFQGIDALHKAGFEQPPSAQYRLVYQSSLTCPCEERQRDILCLIYAALNNTLPADYPGRSLSPSDVVELYDGKERKFFYCDANDFVPVSFSPDLAKPLVSEQGKGVP